MPPSPGRFAAALSLKGEEAEGFNRPFETTA
jgi:hypothetical protein